MEVTHTVCIWLEFCSDCGCLHTYIHHHPISYNTLVVRATTTTLVMIIVVVVVTSDHEFLFDAELVTGTGEEASSVVVDAAPPKTPTILMVHVCIKAPTSTDGGTNT
mmetsp:Transcript_50481/g.57173  ORF Transcript_50481/g.57173 Transcript_50481/m.57173 type:complete len:107 (+) Transcript_50481:128-448(+)